MSPGALCQYVNEPPSTRMTYGPIGDTELKKTIQHPGSIFQLDVLLGLRVFLIMEATPDPITCLFDLLVCPNCKDAKVLT